MKNIYFKIGEPISNVAQISSILSTNIDHRIWTKLPDKFKEQDAHKKFAFKFAKDLLLTHNQAIERIAKIITNKKLLSINFNEILTKSDVREFKKVFFDKLLDEGIINDEEYGSRIFTDITNEQLEKLRKELKKIADDAKKAVFYKQFEGKKIDKVLKRVTLNEQKKYAVNIIPGIENSKNFSVEYSNLKKSAASAIKLKNELENNLKYWLDQKYRLVAASIGVGIASVFCTIFSFVVPLLSFASFATAATSIALSIQISTISKNISAAEEKVNFYRSLTTNSENVGDALKNIHNYLWNTISIKNGVFGIAKTLASDKKFFNKLGYREASAFSKGFALFSVSNDIAEIALSAIELHNINDKIKEINKEEQEIKSNLDGIRSRLEHLKEYKWVVIHETPQTNYYWKGGRGGKNLVFKNLETGEEKTISQMLAYNDRQLRDWGLQRVHDRKRGDYIRKIRNKIKADNLG
ncbi:MULTISPECIES: hypothetical protein [unclassified Mycoplasma]|uniref:hypothetical protein n=1 Tax=unclassified Mycoplasma TaxID=2683645 RepID=UPI00211CA0CE|nr:MULTISPECIES: hypothetical protein [unclassified Mycoplasma]UUM19923.1 hypothetical protein NPA11_00585 [Mycoplasma sp. 1578d]UUM24904.1 hypothetical protein NPA12_00570 [Mycoplasma sp. 3686d]